MKAIDASIAILATAVVAIPIAAAAFLAAETTGDTAAEAPHVVWSAGSPVLYSRGPRISVKVFTGCFALEWEGRSDASLLGFNIW